MNIQIEFKSSGKRWSEHDLLIVREMIKKGSKVKKISDKFGVSVNAIRSLKRDKNLPRRRYHRWKTTELEKIKKLLAVGKSVIYIADLFCMPYNQVERAIKYHKLHEYRNE